MSLPCLSQTSVTQLGNVSLTGQVQSQEPTPFHVETSCCHSIDHS